jgi:hypothetical protein
MKLYHILEDAKERKAVDDPSCRSFDPECWKCLSDEQRDIINEWYYDRLIEDKMRADEDQEKKENNTLWVQFILVWWVFTLFFDTWEYLFEGKYLSFLQGMICACVFSFLIVGGGAMIAETAYKMGISKVKESGTLIFILFMITGQIIR